MTPELGKFASASIRQSDEEPFREVVGLRFKRIEVRVTPEDYLNPQVQEWIHRLFTRRANPHDFTINVTIVWT